MQRSTHCPSSLLYWFPVIFTESPLAFILQHQWTESALGLPTPFITETLDYVPLSLPLHKFWAPAFSSSPLTICLPVSFSLISSHPSGDSGLHCLYHLALGMRVHPGYLSSIKIISFVFFSITCSMMPTICLVFLAAAAHWGDDFED